MAAASRVHTPIPAKLLAIALALGLVFGLYHLILHQSIARYLRNMAHNIPRCTGMHYSRLSIPFFALQAHIQNVTLDFENGIAPITASAVHIRRFRPGTQFPRVLDVALQGVVLDTGHPSLPFGQKWRDLGYSMLHGDLYIQWERRGENQDVWDVNTTLKIAEAGEMAFSFELAKVNAEGVALALAQPYNWLMVLPAIELIDLQGTYLEGGLFGRAVRALAHTRDQSPDAFREALQHRLQMQAQRETNPSVQSVWQSLAAFCRHPDRIRLRTDLKRPIPLGQLLWLHQPRDVIQRLGLECRVG
jgi:hypothetical protein